MLIPTTAAAPAAALVATAASPTPVRAVLVNETVTPSARAAAVAVPGSASALVVGTTSAVVATPVTALAPVATALAAALASLRPLLAPVAAAAGMLARASLQTGGHASVTSTERLSPAVAPSGGSEAALMALPLLPASPPRQTTPTHSAVPAPAQGGGLMTSGGQGGSSFKAHLHSLLLLESLVLMLLAARWLLRRPASPSYAPLTPPA